METNAVCKFLLNVFVNPIEPFVSKSISPASNYSVNKLVACNNNFLSNSFPIKSKIPCIYTKPIIKASIKSIILLSREPDDILTHKFAIP